MSWKISPHKILEIYQDQKGKMLFTRSIVPGRAPFAERLIRENSGEYREFDPTHSKLAAAIKKGCPNVGIRQGDAVLYLGISHGYTASFVSDMVGPEGIIFGIDPAPRVMRDLVFLAEERKNIVPIVADANHPEQYADKICSADIIYQDVAQRNQAEIFIKNCQLFLKKGGYGLLAVKARSIEIQKQPSLIFKEVRQELEKHFTVVDFRLLDPLEKDHCWIMIKK